MSDLPAGYTLRQKDGDLPDGYVIRAQEGMAEHAAQQIDKEEAEAQRRGELGEQFYEPTSINDYELDNPTLRWKISRTEELSDALRLLQPELPEGATAIGLKDPNTGGRVLGFVQEGAEGSPNQFYTIDSPNKITMSDIADAGGIMSLETLGSVAAALDPRMKVAGLTKRLINDFAGAFFGKMADESLDVATGLEENGNVMSESVQAGTLNSVLGRFGDIAPSGINAARGAGAVGNPERAAAVKAAIEESLPGASVSGPLGQRATAISESIGSGIPGREGVENLNKTRRAAVANRLSDNSLENDILELGDLSLMNLIDAARGKARGVAEKVTGKGASKESGGRAVMKGMEEYAESTKAYTDKAYSDYLDLASEEGVVYDLSSVIDAANQGLNKFELTAGYKVTNSELVDASGKPFQQKTQVTQEFGANLDAQLKNLLESMKQLDALQDNPAEATRALKQIRSNLIDLAEKDPMKGGRTQSQGIAAQVLKRLHGALVSPQGASDGVGEAFQRANRLWKARSKTLDAFSFSRSPDEIGAGEILYNNLASNMTEELAWTARKALPDARFREFQGAMIDDLLRNPKSIDGRISQLGKAADTLIPKKMRDTLRVYQRDIRNIDKGVLSHLFEEKGASARRVGEIVERGSYGELKELVASGSIKSKDINGLVFQDLLDKTTHFKEGKLQVDASMFTTHVEKLKKGKFWEILTPSNRSILENLEVYSSFLKSADSGSSIAAAEIAAAQLTPATGMAKASKARIKQIQIGVIAELANSKSITMIFAGKGPEPKPFLKSRATVIGVLQSLNKMTQDEKKTNG